MRAENVVTAPNDGNAQNVVQPKLRSATLIASVSECLLPTLTKSQKQIDADGMVLGSAV